MRKYFIQSAIKTGTIPQSTAVVSKFGTKYIAIAILQYDELQKAANKIILFYFSCQLTIIRFIKARYYYFS